MSSHEQVDCTESDLIALSSVFFNLGVTKPHLRVSSKLGEPKGPPVMSSHTTEVAWCSIGEGE